MENNEFINDDVLDFIRKKNNNGYIVIYGIESYISIPKDEFIEQDIADILYDLNRDEVTTITLAKEGTIHYRWINDLAVAQTIRALKEKLDKYEEKYGKEI